MAKTDPTAEVGAEVAATEREIDAVIAAFLSGEHVAALQAADDQTAAAEATRRIVAANLAADTLDELFTERTVVHARDFLRHPFILLGVDWQKSSIKDSQLPYYAVMTVVNIDGEQQIVTIGGISAMAKLRNLQTRPDMWAKLQETGRRLMVVSKDQPTAAGYYPLDIIYAPTNAPTNASTNAPTN